MRRKKCIARPGESPKAQAFGIGVAKGRVPLEGMGLERLTARRKPEIWQPPILS